MSRMIAVVAGMLLGSVVLANNGALNTDAGTKDEARNAIAELSSEHESARLAARDELLRTRSRQVERLIETLQREKKGETWLVSSTTANVTIAVLGEMRAVEAVPALLDWLLPPDGPYIVPGVYSTSHAGRALIRIGKPAVSGVLNKLRQEAESRGGVRICLKVLVGVEGYERTKSLIQEALDSTEHRGERKRLTGALEVLDKEQAKAQPAAPARTRPG